MVDFKVQIPPGPKVLMTVDFSFLSSLFIIAVTIIEIIIVISYEVTNKCIKVVV
jgi:hypothetical protein